MRLIDADALIENATIYFKPPTDEDYIAVSEVEDAPTIEPTHLDADGTLWVTVDDVDKVGRVIVEHGTWCKTFGEPMQWIPCSERLPKEDGSYLVSGKWGSGKESVGDCEFSVEDGYFQTAWNFDVIAWMPLPEPYRKDEEKGEAE